MKYLVVKPSKDLSKVFILEEGAQITTPFESWALLSGDQIVFSTIKMARILKGHHFAGSYENGALYAYTYEEMCAIITSHIGPSDRARYEALLEATTPEEPKAPVPHDYLEPRYRIAYIIWKTFELVIKVGIKIFVMLTWLVLLPLIIKWVNGFRK